MDFGAFVRFSRGIQYRRITGLRDLPNNCVVGATVLDMPFSGASREGRGLYAPTTHLLKNHTVKIDAPGIYRVWIVTLYTSQLITLVLSDLRVLVDDALRRCRGVIREI